MTPEDFIDLLTAEAEDLRTELAVLTREYDDLQQVHNQHHDAFDAVEAAIREHHSTERHPGTVGWCRDEPCRSIIEETEKF